MTEQLARFEVVVEQGSPHGDLFELEQTTWHHVVDRRSNEVVATFREEMWAKLSTSTGLWDDYQYSGAREVSIASDQRSVIVRYHEGREETVPLPP